MGASSANYTGRTLNDETTTTLVAHHEALWMGFTVAQIKATFYLDYVFITDDGASGFIGGCHVGSANYEMHNTARLGSVFVHAELAPGVWADFKLYLDGGLNTKGISTPSSVLSEYIFDMRISANFKSSYFTGSTAYGFRGRQRNAINTAWEAWQEFNLQPTEGTILAQNNSDFDSQIFQTDRKGFQFEIQPYFTNDEGTFYGTTNSILPKGKLITFYGDAKNYYIDAPAILEGVKLYDDEDLFDYIQIDKDLYIDARYYWVYAYNAISSAWEFIELVDSMPPGPSVPPYYNYTGYSDTSDTDAINQVLYGPAPYSGRLWYDGVNNKYFKVWSDPAGFSVVPSDGWYAWGDASGIDGIVYLVDGEDIY